MNIRDISKLVPIPEYFDETSFIRKPSRLELLKQKLRPPPLLEPEEPDPDPDVRLLVMDNRTSEEIERSIFNYKLQHKYLIQIELHELEEEYNETPLPSPRSNHIPEPLAPIFEKIQATKQELEIFKLDSKLNKFESIPSNKAVAVESLKQKLPLPLIKVLMAVTDSKKSFPSQEPLKFFSPHILPMKVQQPEEKSDEIVSKPKLEKRLSLPSLVRAPSLLYLKPGQVANHAKKVDPLHLLAYRKPSSIERRKSAPPVIQKVPSGLGMFPPVKNKEAVQETHLSPRNAFHKIKDNKPGFMIFGSNSKNRYAQQDAVSNKYKLPRI